MTWTEAEYDDFVSDHRAGVSGKSPLVYAMDMKEALKSAGFIVPDPDPVRELVDYILEKSPGSDARVLCNIHALARKARAKLDEDKPNYKMDGA